jgi:hypothetical protein
MSAVGFRRMITKLGKAAKMPFSVHPHMLRHACGFKLANDGHDTVRLRRRRPGGTRNRNAPRSTLNGYAETSLVVITYLKVSGSSESSLSPSTSAWGYMRKPTLGPDEPGSSMSCAKL